MNKKIAGIVMFFLIIGAGAWYVMHARPSKQPDAAVSQTQDGKTVITMTENGFSPESVKVPAGTTVVFVNKDTYWHWPASDPHPTHTFYPELDPKTPIKPGDSWEVTLSKTGNWGIHDHLAPYITGTISVN